MLTLCGILTEVFKFEDHTFSSQVPPLASLPLPLPLLHRFLCLDVLQLPPQYSYFLFGKQDSVNANCVCFGRRIFSDHRETENSFIIPIDVKITCT